MTASLDVLREVMEREREGPKRKEASRQGILSPLLKKLILGHGQSWISSFCSEPSITKLNYGGYCVSIGYDAFYMRL
jgi:hypothetical protein